VGLTITRPLNINRRYDARLLDPHHLPKLIDRTASSSSPDAVHSASHHFHHHPPRPDSPGGWSDLPSDAEDTFFLTPDETADLHRTKRLRHLDDLRTARLRALSPDPDASAFQPDLDPWGDSDEEVKHTHIYNIHHPHHPHIPIEPFLSHAARRYSKKKYSHILSLSH
jgi:hypothetical protein